MESMSIKPDRDDINGILDKLLRGDISIPTFQRDYIWNNGQIKNFFDSILKGYPVGSLILWSPTDDKFNVIKEIGGINVKSKQSYPTYVLDGRQRLTTLISVLHPDGCNFDKFFLDLDTYFVEYCQHPPKIISYVRLGDLYNTYSIVDYIDTLRRDNLSEKIVLKYSENAKKANRTLLTYYLGYIDVKGGSIKEAVEIFSRLNSQGTPISEDYMLQALAFNHKQNFLLANRITDLKDSLGRYNFSGLKRDVIFNCLYNYIDIPFIDGDVKDLISHIDELPEIFNRLTHDLTNAVRFLYEECGVIDYKLLPYSYQIIMLCMFFSISDEVDDHVLLKLKKWFLYTTSVSYFTSHSLSEIRNDIIRFKAFANKEEEMPISLTEKIDLSIPPKINLGSVQSCAFIILSLLRTVPRNNNIGSKLIIRKIYPEMQKTFENCIICSSEIEFSKVMECLKGTAVYNEDLMKYGITPELVKLYSLNSKKLFLEEREKVIATLNKDFENLI